MSALRFSGAQLRWVKASMYGTAFRANNLPFQTLVTRSSWHILFVGVCNSVAYGAVVLSRCLECRRQDSQAALPWMT